MQIAPLINCWFSPKGHWASFGGARTLNFLCFQLMGVQLLLAVWDSPEHNFVAAWTQTLQEWFLLL